VSRQVTLWRQETLTLPEPWADERVRSALNEQGRRYIDLTDMCLVLGIKDVQTQVDNIRAGIEAGEIDAAALETIELDPREDAKPRAGSRPHACLWEDELGWWAIHIKPAFMNDKSRTNVGLIRHAVKMAATRGIFTGPPIVVQPGKLLSDPTHHSSGDVACAWCHRYLRVTITEHTTTAEKVIDL
jgi:hypothetical protein